MVGKPEYTIKDNFLKTLALKKRKRDVTVGGGCGSREVSMRVFVKGMKEEYFPLIWENIRYYKRILGRIQ